MVKQNAEEQSKFELGTAGVEDRGVNARRTPRNY
jgi:hypothetical protein